MSTSHPHTPFVLSEVEGRAASAAPETRTSTSPSANGVGDAGASGEVRP